MREHWLEHAHGRIVAGDDELEVLADYGWVQITDAEREAVEASFDAIQYAADELGLAQADCDRHAATLRNLLKRVK